MVQRTTEEPWNMERRTGLRSQAWKNSIVVDILYPPHLIANGYSDLELSDFHPRNRRQLKYIIFFYWIEWKSILKYYMSFTSGKEYRLGTLPKVSRQGTHFHSLPSLRFPFFTQRTEMARHNCRLSYSNKMPLSIHEIKILLLSSEIRKSKN